MWICVCMALVFVMSNEWGGYFSYGIGISNPTFATAPTNQVRKSIACHIMSIDIAVPVCFLSVCVGACIIPCANFHW